MQTSKWKEIASKVQLEVDLGTELLAGLEELEKLLSRFRKLKLKQEVFREQNRLDLVCLKELTKKYSEHLTSQYVLKHNAFVSPDNLITTGSLANKNKNNQ